MGWFIGSGVFLILSIAFYFNAKEGADQAVAGKFKSREDLLNVADQVSMFEWMGILSLVVSLVLAAVGILIRLS